MPLAKSLDVRDGLRRKVAVESLAESLSALPAGVLLNTGVLVQWVRPLPQASSFRPFLRHLRLIIQVIIHLICLSLLIFKRIRLDQMKVAFEVCEITRIPT